MVRCFAGEAYFVGDHEDGQPLILQVFEDIEYIVLAFRVESTGDLITQECQWLHGQGPSDGDPLLLTSG